MAVAAVQGASQHQEEFGVQYLAQGHFKMQTRGIKPVNWVMNSIEFQSF